ncbi:putative nuclease HARBI1 [Lampris incognitus]|uniref:putative nuclease HARBI1 n=1 Tax=Lampris incognitus TaxID=2546036 RepID=UPI0024B604A8|nr:putative nuclease HARBI1 [Lampris incognitus]
MAFAPAPAVWFVVQDELIRNGAADEYPPKNVFDHFDDETLFETFHLTRPCIDFITDIISLSLKGPKPKSHPAFSVEGMVMTALNYYAHGVCSVSIQKLGISLSDSPGVIRVVSKVLAGMADQFITFPRAAGDKANMGTMMERFCGMPKVLGVLAGAHFKIRACPYEKDSFRSFINTLGYTSVTSQIVCDAYGNLLSVEKCCVGSTPEQEMWESSSMKQEMEDATHGQYWLIAGRGYHLSKHVLTAVSQPLNDKDFSFNEAHSKIQAVMRKTLCSLKRRFRCLMQLGFAKENSLDRKTDIIHACCVLYNIAKKFSVPAPPMVGKTEPTHPGKQYQMPVVPISPEALEARQELINARFTVVPQSQKTVSPNSTAEGS